jgi:hypothetical protein
MNRNFLPTMGIVYRRAWKQREGNEHLTGKTEESKEQLEAQLYEWNGEYYLDDKQVAGSTQCS